MFEKIKFWKKDPIAGKEFGLGQEPDFSLPPLDQDRTAGLGGTGQIDAGITIPSKYTEDDMGLGTPVGPAKFGGLTPTSLQQPRSSQPQPGPQSAELLAKDLEIISSKLDAVRSSIEVLNHRLSLIEQKLQQKKNDW
ncbi:hypothetical protein HYU19_03445 [Candidatus Woesearchaeota archaeon]|nr:hypothetical protein [Candidatus Woesearchaeota archaeon]